METIFPEAPTAAKDPALRYHAPSDLLTDIQLVKKGEAPHGARPALGKSSISQPREHRSPGSTAESPAVQILPDRATENAEQIERLIGQGAANSPYDSKAGSGTRTKRAVQAAIAANRGRMAAQVSDADQGFRFALIVGVAAVVAVVAFLIISMLSK